jgi:hypothetical protein
MTLARKARLGVSIALLAAGSAGCQDPVHDAEVAALGPEQPGVPPGPDHRPGQPCLVCHGGSGPARFVMSFGGTTFKRPLSFGKEALAGATIYLTDATGLSYEAESNCVGNFFIQPSEFNPTFPVHDVSIALGVVNAEMQTHIGRNGSCASCHTGADDPSQVDLVYLVADTTTVIPPSSIKCP